MCVCVCVCVCVMSQRKLGQRTGTCFQRCVGMDATNATFSITYDIDEAHGTLYHARFKVGGGARSQTYTRRTRDERR